MRIRSRSRARSHEWCAARLVPLAVCLTVFGLARPVVVAGQAAQPPQTAGMARTIVVATGKAALITHPVALRRVSVANAEVAEAVVVSPTEILLHGKATGTTSLVIWDASGGRALHAVEVTADAGSLERHFQVLFPGEKITVLASGNTFVLSGTLGDATVARRAVEIATATGSPVVDNMQVPAPHQVLLQVRIAEVNRSAMRELSANIVRVDPFNLRGDHEGASTTGRHTPLSQQFLNTPAGPEQTFSDAVNLFLFHPEAQLGVFLRALQAKGHFKSLAEPNLLALDGTEASFLAGGEFPFPVLQGGAASNAVTILFKEFGVRLKFTPRITNAGNIHLKVAPEVSSLDFANGLQVSGFQIPTLLTRRSETEVELRDGQTFAIAGLIDNTMTENADKIPILGDIPILGAFFRSQDRRHNRTELLVLVTPRLVQPSATPPPLPTGEPATWDWDKSVAGPANQASAAGAR